MESSDALSSGRQWVTWEEFWEIDFEDYSHQLLHLFIVILYSLYKGCTIINMFIFFVKYFPTGVYLYKLVRNVYFTAKERIKQKKIELEDMRLQIHIVDTRLCVCFAESSEREELVRHEAKRLRALRVRVRDVIASDETLQRALDQSSPWNDEPVVTEENAPDEDCEFVISMIKQMKTESPIPEVQTEKVMVNESGEPEPNSSDQSIYSSLNELDTKDCRVKIVKVTNVYKVAYLKHFIKQKRMQRATKQAMLKKRIETIKKLLEEWQKSLTMVINTKHSIMSHNPMNVASQEAMGDYSKLNLKDSSDSDNDLRNMCNDGGPYFEEYNLSWSQNPYKNYPYNYDDNGDSSTPYESSEYADKYQSSPAAAHFCECNVSKAANVLFILPEETKSQLAIEEINGKPSSEMLADCRDIIAI